jgi:hypothetical protein
MDAFPLYTAIRDSKKYSREDRLMGRTELHCIKLFASVSSEGLGNASPFLNSSYKGSEGYSTQAAI